MKDRPELFKLLRDGLKVHVVGGNRFPDKLLGIRDGFERIFSKRVGFQVNLSIQILKSQELPERIPMSEEELWCLTRDKVAAAEQSYLELHPFLMCVESGLIHRELFDKSFLLVKTVALVQGLGGEAIGSSGEMQLPEALVTDTQTLQSPSRLPGTRRAGGMIQSLTGGLETRRSHAAQATFNALATLCWGMLPSSITR